MKDELDGEIARITSDLKSLQPGSPLYKERLELLLTLIDIKTYADEKHSSLLGKVTSNPALLGVLGNLTALLMIMSYERAGNIIVTRAFSIFRPR